MNPTALSRLNGSIPSNSSHSWLHASVREFFSTLNWEGHPPEVQNSLFTSSQLSTEPLSLSLSVSRFFAAINWDGSEIAAPVKVKASPPKSKVELTLDDFSDLF